MKSTDGQRPMTVDEYLELENAASTRHEFVAGQIYAMTGATDAHNCICINLGSFFHAKLKGTGCRVYMNEMKVRIESGTRFYYPDVMVTCEPYSAESVYKSAPKLIVEVLSRSTKQIDLREKLAAYKSIPSVQEYLIVQQKRKCVIQHQRQADGGWIFREIMNDESLILTKLRDETVLSLDTIYEGTNIISRVKEEEMFYSAVEVSNEDNEF